MRMQKPLAAILSFVLAGALLCMPVLADSLRKGDRGEDVKALQELLKSHNFYNYKEITGFYGKITEDGVRAFQRKAGLEEDGIAGRITLQKLNERKPTAATSASGSLKRGMQSSEVNQVQQRLMALGLLNISKATSFYGPATEKAVIAFQKAAGLKADGIVGAKTKALLYEQRSSSSLVVGMRNNDVKKMQKRLKELGYFSGSVDGVFGQQTEKYVTYFQQLNGLTQDGIAGKKTLAKLYSDNCPTEKKARRSTSSSGAGSGSSGQSAGEPGGAQDVIAYAKTFLGVPYVYGTSGPDAFDCTGFTCYVYKKFGISLPRSAQTQGYNNYGTKIDSIANLQPGDLVFFNTISDNDLSDHAGIYIGEGKFIHATSYRPHGRQVVIGTLASGSYNRNFSWGRRVLR